MKKKVAIEIDFLLRNWLKALISVYKKQIDDQWVEKMINLNELYKYFPFPVYAEVAGETYDIEISENIMVLDESKDYEPNQEYFNKFLFDNVLEIFGHAEEPEPNTISSLNHFIKSDKDHDITIFSKINGKGISATLFFLSKCGCECSNIKFLKNYKELEEFDKIIVSENNLDNIVEEFKKEIICLKSIKDLTTLIL